MEFHCLERMTKHQLQRFSHVTKIRKRRAHEIAKVRAAEWTMKDLLEHYRTDNRVILMATNEETNGLRFANTLQKNEKILVSFWR